MEPFKPRGWLWRRPRRELAGDAVGWFVGWGTVGVVEESVWGSAGHRRYVEAFAFWVATTTALFFLLDVARYALWRRGVVFERRAAEPREAGEPRIMRHES